MNNIQVHVQVTLAAPVLSAGEKGVADMKSEYLAKFLSYACFI
jgi:hypothetical protein